MQDETLTAAQPASPETAPVAPPSTVPVVNEGPVFAAEVGNLTSTLQAPVETPNPARSPTLTPTLEASSSLGAGKEGLAGSAPIAPPSPNSGVPASTIQEMPVTSTTPEIPKKVRNWKNLFGLIKAPPQS